MFSLRRQILLLLGVTVGSLLVAKTLVDFSRSRPRVEDEARARGQVTLLQARSLLERTAADGTPDPLRGVLRQLATTPGVRQVALIRPDGTVLASSRPELEDRPAAETSLSALLDLDLRSGGMEVAGEALRAAAPVRLPSLAHDPAVPGPPAPVAGTVALILESDLAAPFAAARLAAVIENGIGFAIAVVMLALIGLLLEVRLGRPARRIVAAIEQFDRGERAARSGIRGPDEFGSVARAFDSMADRLQAEEIHVLDTQNALDGLLKALPVGVLVVKREDGRPYYVNPRWRDLFGIHMEVNRDILAILSTVRCERPDGSPYPIEQLPITTVLRTGAPAEVRDLCVRRDDRVVRLIAHAVPVSLAHGGGFDAALVIAREAEPGEATLVQPPTASGALAAAGGGAVPAAAAEVAIGAERASQPPMADDVGLPTVLVVDADPDTCDRAASALREASYRVLVAEDGARALSLLRNEGPRIEVIVLDLSIEGPGGASVLDDLLRFDPAARVIAASQYRPELPELAASGKVTAFLTRPYGPDRLVRAVREAIGVAPHLERAFAP